MNAPPNQVAVIDLGSNTARLVLIAAIPGYSYRLQDEIREVVRLRQGITKKGLDEAAARAISTLRLFKRFCESTGAEVVLSAATSAVRDAANGLAGFSPREIALIGLLARYHRKGAPDISTYEALLGADDLAILTRLAAILRLAENLERGRNGVVDDVIVNWGEDYLRLTLIADEYPAVELWETERNALPLVEKAFERRALVDSIAAPGEWPHHGSPQ